VLTSDGLLQEQIPSSYLRWGLLLLAATGLYLFFAPAVIDPFLESEARLKEMVEETLHELNTPIATIEANLSMLKRSIDDPKAKKRLERIGEAAKNLTKLYESIEYEIKENIEHIEKEQFGLREAAAESIGKFEEIRGDIAIENNIEERLLYTDRNGFIRMLDNLLSNAIKYNRPGGFVKLYSEGDHLYIEDSGIGIDPKNLFIVYEKSFQENPTTVGYGLGLSIVKNFCDREKITIKIDTEKGKGTKIALGLSSIIYK
jgi:signal transduction histidine kinase